MADWRDKFCGQHYAKKIGKIEPNLKELQEILRPEHSLLDVGCNIGSVYGFLNHQNYEGFDLDPEAVEEAKKRFPGVNFHVGDLFDLDGIWDVVLVSRVLMHVAHLEEAMRRLLRSSMEYLVLFVPIAPEDECEIHGHDLNDKKVYSYFRRFSEKTFQDFGRCRIINREPYSTVIYDR